MTQLQDLSAAISSLAARASASLVALSGRGTRATGFVWKSGLIVTSDEALPDEGDITATLPDGSRTTLTIAGRDATTDVALLKGTTGAAAPVTLADTVPLLGTLTVAVGHDGEGPVASFGMVCVSRGAWRSMRGGEINARLELDMRLRRIAQGGLATDGSGQVFGMTVFGPRRRVLVIPTATIQRVTSKLETHGRIARGYLGLGLQPVSVEGASMVGAMIISVDPKGPGAAAGLHQGDVLVGMDGQPITSVSALVASLGPDSVGRAVKLSLRRGGAVQDVALVISERPAA